jgi:hypothetical protein
VNNVAKQCATLEAARVKKAAMRMALHACFTELNL